MRNRSVAESNHIARPVGSRRNLFIELAPVFRNARGVEHQLGPAALLGLVGQHVDQRLGDAFSTMIVVHINMIDLPCTQAGHRFGQIVKDHEADQISVDPGSQRFSGTVLKQMLGIEIIGAARSTALQRLRIACQQRRELMGIPQMEERNIDGMIFGHWTFLGVSGPSARSLRSSSARKTGSIVASTDDKGKERVKIVRILLVITVDEARITMANCRRTIFGAAVVGVLALAGAARADDASGNLVIQMPDNGAKIIRVGAAQKTASSSPQRMKVITAPRDRAVAYIVDKPNSNCESAVVLRGRAFMYGIDRGETPVLDHAKCGYQ